MSVQEQKPIELDSGYIVQGLFHGEGALAVHQLRVSLAQGGEARLILDPNRCQLDAFGETQGCTRIATRSYEVKLQVLQESQGRQLLCLTAADYEGPPLRLVLGSAGGAVQSARLLVLGAEDAIQEMRELTVVR